MQLLCVEIVDSLLTNSLTEAHFMLKPQEFIDLFLCEISFSFQVKFLRPSDRRSNSQINYRHYSEWEEPKQNGVLVPFNQAFALW